MQFMGMECREAAEYLKLLDNICSYCKQTFQLQLSQTREILCMSQSKDMSQVLSEFIINSAPDRSSTPAQTYI